MILYFIMSSASYVKQIAEYCFFHLGKFTKSNINGLQVSSVVIFINVFPLLHFYPFIIKTDGASAPFCPKPQHFSRLREKYLLDNTAGIRYLDTI